MQGDGIVAGTNVTQVDVRFEIVWHSMNTSAGADKVLATFNHHFVRNGTGFNATSYMESAPGLAANAAAGDQLMLRILPIAGDPGADFIPNGDGANAAGKIPRIDLPH